MKSDLQNISPSFTVEDIHKVREQSYENRKDMTPEEICEDTHTGAERFLQLFNAPLDSAIESEVIGRLQSPRRLAV
ncbi:MAG: hypothetical protein LBV09_01360 [Deferribacteraceae bacterium]|jgi:hypothetical protein|nr:hypothetical protein [Deferribacteraceae bacterium]